LDQYVLFLALQQLDDRFRRLYAFGQQNADPLRAFEQFDDDRCTADPFNGWKNVLSVANESGLGNADLVATENLQATEFVSGIGNSS
jgi:hypothetical protein